MTIEVDPYEALVNLMLADSALSTEVSSQINTRHSYGQDSGDWDLDSKSLVLTPISGAADIYNDVQNCLVLARCYAGLGNSEYEAGQVYKALADFCQRKSNGRYKVAVTEGSALVYFVLLTTRPRMGVDEEIAANGGMIYHECQINFEVANETVP